MFIFREKQGGLVLDEREVMLDEAHVVALAAATKVPFSMNKIRNAAHHKDRERVSNVRDLDINWVKTVSKYG